jgi:stage V sporulation protein D (sporulation-specific penicillin-binding protein)
MKKSSGKNRRFTSRMQTKLLFIFCVLTILSLGLMGRMLFIMKEDGDRYTKSVLSRQSYVSKVLPYRRGSILDRNGTVLANSDLRYRLILDAKLLNEYPENISETKDVLEKYFNIDPQEIEEKLTKRKDSQYIILAKNLKYSAIKDFKMMMENSQNLQEHKNTADIENKTKTSKDKALTDTKRKTAQNSKDIKAMGIWFEQEYIRTYPCKTLACDVLGFSNSENRGYYGIEEYYNNELNGINGREYGYYDATLNIERVIKKAENGHTIVSTIDANAQRIIQKYINKFNSEKGYKNIGILVMNPNNGEILAMASNQEYDLNSPSNLESIYTKKKLAMMSEKKKEKALYELWKNDVISFNYEPGSTFKPCTVAAALEEAVVSEKSTFFCDGIEHGQKCSHKHGELTLAGALIHSCNDSLMQIGDLLGKKNFCKYVKKYGFGAKTGIDLPGEEKGQVIALENMGVVDLAACSYGQSNTVTMVQLASVYSSLVNGGNYYQPHIVKQILNDKGAIVKEIEKTLVRKTVSEGTSKFIQKTMYRTVNEGTAKNAKVEGYAVGGKTGTAEKQPRKEGKNIVSFLGNVPAINPEIVFYVIIDEPQNVPKQTSGVATEFAGEVLKELLPALGIYPDGKIDYLLDDDNDGDIKKGLKKSKDSSTDKKTGTDTEKSKASDD